MRSVQEVERLLYGPEHHTSPAFDARVVRDMFAALDAALKTSPVHSWRDRGREIMNRRSVKVAAAAVLAIGLLLLALQVSGRQEAVEPSPDARNVARAPNGDTAVPSPAPSAEDRQRRLARERDTAQTLFLKSDVEGLLQLLDLGLDETKITVAGFLAEIGDKSALPALRRLAERWEGPVGDNPFRESVEALEGSPSSDERVDTEPAAPEEAAATSPTVDNGHHYITVQVCDETTGEPIPNATIYTFAHRQSQTQTADANGVFVFDLGKSLPDIARVAAREPGYVWKSLELRGPRSESLPKMIQFSLARGTVVGGVVQDAEGNPIQDASVQSYISEPQQHQTPTVNVSIREITDAEGRWRSANVPAEIDRLWFNVRHPDFADGGFEMPRNLDLEDLRAERAVMVLDAGIAVVGRVTDSAGNPIAGAELLAGSDYYARDRTKTDPNGYFELAHLLPINRSFLLTVQATGFAPQRRELPSESGLDPVDFVLEPAKLLLGRVVDVDGEPVEGVFITTEEWNGWRTVKWSGKTDAEGRFTWDYPPADAIRLSLSKSGYRSHMRDVVADDREQTFVLARPVVIKGSVVDSETGEPVKRFKVTPGIGWTDGGTRSTWQGTDSWVRWFTDGQYSYTFSADGQAYAVRVEADGYMPAESRFVDANEQEVTIDIALTKARGPSGYVFDANAAPVAGATVFWDNAALIQNGRVRQHNYESVKTDGEGRFAFAADLRGDPVLAICDHGMGFASPEDLARDGFITLTPWARVQGQLWIGRQPGAGRALRLTPQPTRVPKGINMFGDEAVTDADGRFVFERVFPGEFTLYDQTYEVAPGETLELHLGGTGFTVKGELAIPVASDVPIWVLLYLVPANPLSALDAIPKPDGFEQMSRDQLGQWFKRVRQTPEGKAFLDAYQDSQAKRRVEMDDRTAFHVDNVPPGRYALKGTIRYQATYERMITQSGLGRGVAPASDVVGRVYHEIEVPELADESELDAPLDVGTVPVHSGELKPGDPAPSFDVRAFGPGHLRLADFRGKVLLLNFCSSNDLTAASTTLEELRSLYQQFGTNAAYAQVTLLLDGHPFIHHRAMYEATPDWPWASLVGKDGPEAVQYGVTALPWNVLIGPHGEVLAVGLSGEALGQAIHQTLATLR